jgi:hypothetical protein
LEKVREFGISAGDIREVNELAARISEVGGSE